jgi:hypothetical protein
MRSGIAIVLGSLALGACGSTSEADWPIANRWEVSQNASPECLSAARRATKFCLDRTLNSDIYGVYTSECTRAQWEYARHCP